MKLQSRTVRNAAVAASFLLLAGCYTVQLEAIPAVPATALSVSAQLNIPKETSDFTYDVRSMAAGITNRWRILVGPALVQYADAYLRPVFPEGNDVSIAITIERFDVHDFEAHIDARFSVSKEGETLFTKSYHAKGKGYFARTAWAGAFAMKSSMRNTTNEALRSLLEQFLTDVNVDYTGWAPRDMEIPIDHKLGFSTE